MYLSDLHTHTIASGHGTTCTISDMAKAASARGLKLLGITDHGPGTLAAGTPSYFRSLSYAPSRRFGLEVLYGAECSILDTEGHLDLEDDILELLDYAVISMHTVNLTPGTREENTRAFLAAMQHPAARILGHCDDPRYPLDYETLVREAKRKNIIPEVNEASLTPGGYRGDTRPCCRELLSRCLKTETPILLSSDSHGPEHVGDFTWSAAFVHQQVFPEELILNNQLPRLKMLLTGWKDE